MTRKGKKKEINLSVLCPEIIYELNVENKREEEEKQR
jgi:hypothetical protein